MCILLHFNPQKYNLYPIFMHLRGITMKRPIIKLLILTAIISQGIAYADPGRSVEFFASNNTQTITLKKAYQRLTSTAQAELIDSTISFAQQKHLEQGSFSNILGTYQMTKDHNITGDNSEVYYASPYQIISRQKAFTMASQLAKKMNQESVAVFIPGKQKSIAEINVVLKSDNIHINDTIKFIKDRLSPKYATAFSLTVNRSTDFNRATIIKIEWLGNHLNMNVIKRVFPNDRVSAKDGCAYLVFANGKRKFI